MKRNKLGTIALTVSYILIIYIWLFIFIPKSIPYFFRTLTPRQPLNLLILGTDKDYNKNEAVILSHKTRTDTILIVNLNPFNSKINILSIPRDTLVNIPGYGWNKINSANVYGGIPLIKDTVKKSFGLEIDRYIRVNIPDLVNLMDSLGGIKIQVERDMYYTDRAAGLFINLKKGWNTLKGKDLEGFIRFRHDLLGDIGRVQHQQEFFKAVLGKLGNPTTVIRLPWLIFSVKNIETDIPFGQLVRIANFMRMQKPKDIRMILLPGDFSNISNGSYWMPDLETDRKIIGKYFSWKGVRIFSPKLTTLPKIAIYNNSGDSKSLNHVLEKLKETKCNIISIQDNIGDNLLASEIIAQKGDEAEAKRLGHSLGIKKVEVSSIGDLNSDFTIVIGKDYK